MDSLTLPPYRPGRDQTEHVTISSIAGEIERGKEAIILDRANVGRVVNAVRLHKCDLWITRRRGVTYIRGRAK